MKLKPKFSFLLFAVLLASLRPIAADHDGDVVDDLTEKSICHRLARLGQFKSKARLIYHEREFHIEEYRLAKKGRLSITENDETKEIYYENRETETSVVYYNRNTNQCSQEYFNHRANQLDVPYKFFSFRTGIFGVTGLWAIIEDHIAKFELETKTVDERGVDAHVCKGSVSFGEGVLSLVWLHVISDEEWEIFDQRNVSKPQLLKMHIISDRSLPGEDDSQPFAMAIEYLMFETIDETESENEIINLNEIDSTENVWEVPSTCFRAHRTCPQIEMPTEFKMTLDKVDSLSNELIYKINVMYNKKNDLLILEKTTAQDQTPLTKIIRLNEQFNLEHRQGHCKYAAQHDKLQDFETDIIDLVQVLFSMKDSEFDLMGNRILRNMLTDVYVMRKTTLKGEQIDSMYVVPLDDQNTPFTHRPVQIKTEIFKSNGTTRQTVESYLYSVYDFEALDTDERQVDAAIVPECTGQGSTEFVLAAKNNFTGPLSETDHEAFKDELRQKLANLTGETILNFPLVDVSIGAKEILSRVRYRDWASPIMYFKTMAEKQLLYSEGEDVVLKDLKTVEECAEKSLSDENSLGFQFCDDNDTQECRMIHASPEDVSGKLTIKRLNSVACRVEKKFLTSSDFKYEKFDVKMKKLIESVNANQLIVKHLNLDHRFVFDKIHFNREESKIDRTHLYKLSREGHSMKSSTIGRHLLDGNGLMSVAECYAACTDPKNQFPCSVFAFCRRPDDAIECRLANLTMIELRADFTSIEPEDGCDLYEVSWLAHFQENADKRLVDTTKSTFNRFPGKSASDCAQLCSDTNSDRSPDDERCLSIQVCLDYYRDPICWLSHNQTIWTSDQKLLEDSDKCNVYSVKHILNFFPRGQSAMKNFVRKPVISADECATACDMAGDCDMFNHCATESGQWCHYARQSEIQNTEPLESPYDLLGCVTYVHRSQNLGAPKRDKLKLEDVVVTRHTGAGYTVGSVFKFIFIFLFVGLLIGVIVTGYISRKQRSRETSAIPYFLDPNAGYVPESVQDAQL